MKIKDLKIAADQEQIDLPGMQRFDVLDGRVDDVEVAVAAALDGDLRKNTSV